MRPRAVIFDWAGVVADAGGLAIVDALRRAFSAFDVEISAEHARIASGFSPHDQVRAIGGVMAVAEQWAQRGQGPFDDAAARSVTERLEPMLAETTAARAALIDGVADTIEALRGIGAKIGLTTEYPRAVFEPLADHAKSAGVTFDATACADEAPLGRPAPFLLYRCLTDLEIWPADTVACLDDTRAGVAAARAAGCLSVGVTLTGDGAGLDAAALAALPGPERTVLQSRIGTRLRQAGAHHVTASAADLAHLLGHVQDPPASPWERLVRDGRRPVNTPYT